MANEVTTTENKALINFSNEDLKIIKSQFFPQSATESDINYCMGVARSTGLNPILKEIWFIERKANINGQWVTKIEPMAGRDSYIKAAHRSGDFGGIETISELREVPYLNNGKWETKKDLVAISKVYKVGIEKPFISEVNYNEYVQTTKDGSPTKFWKEKPHTMIRKVAESQALRKAFNINGIYDEAESREEEEEIPTAAIVLSDEEQTNLDMRLAKTSLANKLKKMQFTSAMIKEFAEFHKIGNDIDTIQLLLEDEEAFSIALENFEKEGK